MHHIEGFIGKLDHLQKICKDHDSLEVVPCPRDHKFGFIPVTDELYDLVRDMHISECPTCGHELNPMESFGEKFQPIALIETDYFGGGGEQSAILWKDNKRKRFKKRIENNIDKALKELGVVAEGNMDEFDTLGLSQHRTNESWLGRDN